MPRFFTATFLLLTIAVLHPATAQNATTSPASEPAYGPELEGYDYPYPVHQFEFSSQKQTMHMAYMDVKPKSFNGQVIVLMHGKNFCSATWKASIDVLADAGYRVIAVDQIGFCKSTKPQLYQYTFQQLAKHACSPRIPEHPEADSGRAFYRRHDRHSLCTDVSPLDQATGSG
jgi:pimeloyl-ACP methyl ester carboxylesterase